MSYSLPFSPTPLTTYGKWKLSTKGYRREKHDNLIPLTRYQAMTVQRRLAPGNAMKSCGLRPIPTPDNQISLCITEKGARFQGVSRCRSQFCIDCASYAKETRIERIGGGIRGAIATNKPVYFLTLTTQRSPDPTSQINALQEGWKLLQGRLAYRLKKQGIRMHFVRGLDVTFRPGRHDIYHSHLHIVFVLGSEFVPYRSKGIEYETFESMVSASWVDIQLKKGIKADIAGQRIERVEKDRGLSRYLAKFDGLGHEIVNFHAKTGKQTQSMKENQSIGWMQLVGRVYRGESDCEAIYHRFLCSVKGKRTISFSGLWDDLVREDPKEPEEEIEPRKIEIPINMVTFWEIRECGVDAFCLAAYSSILTTGAAPLLSLLDMHPSREEIKAFIDFFG